jgi:hypothetical protein
MTTWQPIETAPRDGTEVLLADARGGIWIAGWRDEQHFSHGKLVREATGFTWHPDYCSRSGAPIFWAPIPPYPGSEVTGDA